LHIRGDLQFLASANDISLVHKDGSLIVTLIGVTLKLILDHSSQFSAVRIDSCCRLVGAQPFAVRIWCLLHSRTISYDDPYSLPHPSIFTGYASLVQEIYSIRLPGNPKLGEGKPENQNHAIVFTRGEAIQTIDMNQVYSQRLTVLFNVYLRWSYSAILVFCCLRDKQEKIEREDASRSQALFHVDKAVESLCRPHP